MLKEHLHSEDAMSDMEENIKHTSSDAIEEPEAWEPWETWLCSVSIVLGISGLVILGFIVDYFFL